LIFIYKTSFYKNKFIKIFFYKNNFEVLRRFGARRQKVFRPPAGALPDGAHRAPERGPRAPQRALRVEQATPSPPPIHIVSQGERAQRERGAKRSNL
jgi:hypothetical protein